MLCCRLIQSIATWTSFFSNTVHSINTTTTTTERGTAMLISHNGEEGGKGRRTRTDLLRQTWKHTKLLQTLATNNTTTTTTAAGLSHRQARGPQAGLTRGVTDVPASTACRLMNSV